MSVSGSIPQKISLPEEGLCLTAVDGRIRLRLRAMTMGEDVCLLLDGGDRPHIGAAALSGPGEGATVVQRPSHREAELSESLATKASKQLGRPVAVVCGIHLDDITTEEIESVLNLSHSLLQKMVDHLTVDPCGDNV